MKLVPSLLALLLSGSTLLHAQKQAPGTTKDDEDVVKAGPKDPFTQADPKAMAAAGVIAYGPFVWADQLRTEDVEKVLGQGRILWLETAHFQIAFNLATTTQPEDPEARKLMNGDLQRLHKRFAKFPERSSKIEPWLRLHVYAQRAEELYKEFQQLIGHDEASGTFLGQKGKFPLVMFQKKSDVARYLDRFCGKQSQQSQRHFYGKTGQNGFVLAAEADEPRDDAQIQSQFRFLLIQTFTDAMGGAPYWLDLGLAHWFERQVPSRLMMAVPKDDESVDEQTQHKWPSKMKSRAQHQKLLIPFADLATRTDFGYWAHLQAWSRVDFLMQRDRAKFGEFLGGLGGAAGASKQAELLERVFGLTPEAFDAAWREWVLKTYR